MIEEDLLQTIVCQIVDYPDYVRVSRSTDEMGVLLTLEVHPEDMGKIIGKEGNIAKAIRTVVRAVGMKHKARVNVRINEPGGGKRTHSVRERYPDTAASVDEAMAEIKGL